MERINKVVLYLLVITALQFFIQGTWSMTLGLVLKSNGMGVMIRSAFFLLGVATVISPIFVGYMSDKTTSPQKILSLLHFSNAINMIGLYYSFVYVEATVTIILIFIMGLLFYPTTALVSSLTFQNISSDSIFPMIRSFGTIGFMISGFLMGFYNMESSFKLYLFSSFSSVVLALISFFAPFNCNHIVKNKSSSILKSLKSAIYLVQDKKAVPYLVCALFMMISQLSYSAYMPVYLYEIGFSTPAALMQVAVMSELVFMLCLPVIMIRMRINSLMLIGTLTYALRSFITINIDAVNFYLIIFALILQGVSWVIFFISFDILIKRISLVHNQHQMQGFKVIFINGLGVSMASLICGYAFNNLMDGKDINNWGMFWTLPLVMSVVSFVIIVFNRKHVISKME